jgi:DNA-binding NarL/FixJ family response regulator
MSRDAPEVAEACIRVLVADDHSSIRSYVREALEADSRFEVCAEVADGMSAVDQAVRERPDVCLLDIHMPGGGIAAAWEIKSRLPSTKIVMLTVSESDDDLFAALRSGASGYLLKGMDLSRLPHALADIAAGRAAIPRELVARVLGEFRDDGPRRRTVLDTGGYPLTSREWQVADLLRRGLSTAQIAERLFIAPATVRTHVAGVLRKLGAADRESALELLNDVETPS